MFIRTVDKSKYISACDVKNFPITDWKTDPEAETVELFGKPYLLRKDPWMHHLHIKCTNICNARCHFCVEQNSRCKENPDKVLENVDLMLNELNKTGLLYSVSVTGGEPLVWNRFQDLCEILKRYDIGFLTINTNGIFLKEKLSLIDGLFDFVDLSRHRILDADNNKVFCFTQPTIDDLRQIKSKMQKTKLRIQCVMDHPYLPEEMNRFTSSCDFADDISYRRLMSLGSEYGVSYPCYEAAYNDILKYAYDNFSFIEQSLQDYYVYEVWHDNANNKNVTFSYSDMKMLRESEGREPENQIREFVIHPNGVCAGSWNPSVKIVKD